MKYKVSPVETAGCAILSKLERNVKGSNWIGKLLK